MKLPMSSCINLMTKAFFNFDSPPPPEKPYLFIVKKDGFVVPFNIDVPNPENIIIEGFPDPKKTRITGKILIDQRGRPVPSGYSLVITPKTTPESVVVQEGKSLEFDVEQGMYDIIFYDGEGRKYASRNMFDVRPGMPHSLPLDVTVMPGR
jgi:hypothetical protein